MARKKEPDQKPFADRFPTRESAILEHLASNVRELRQENGLSQEALATMVDVQQNEISKIENRRSNPTILTLERLAQAFGVTVPRLLQPSVVNKRKS
ncbi:MULTISPECIES: helix-turn-helix transcriptional regulator [unclassified Bradyrhizobium]|uniref:helix-turn-helix transcriptional regulator n=1 Tax=unclassified Bradyrhizobium TaxID=2631580 RepID=UPI00263A9667|nr:helix-turn-helix transcriptional regulator [Bradyrhizobium sp. WYCCWR 13022]